MYTLRKIEDISQLSDDIFIKFTKAKSFIDKLTGKRMPIKKNSEYIIDLLKLNSLWLKTRINDSRVIEMSYEEFFAAQPFEQLCQ